MNNSAKILFVLAAGWLTTTAFAQDRIHYTGKELSNPAYHDGQLSPVVGVHNIDNKVYCNEYTSKNDPFRIIEHWVCAKLCANLCFTG